jgi:hypothetical protein
MPIIMPFAFLIFKLGIIGTDTSHAGAFANLLNGGTVPGAKIVAAYKGGSPDVESSRTRIDNFAKELETKWGVEMFSDIPTMAAKVDGILLLSVDGRAHLPQFRAALAAKKPIFIDKPLASTLADAREIDRLAKAAGVPWFSASSLRYSEIVSAVEGPGILGATTWGPGPFEEHHQLDLSWYAIHPIEILFTLMGPGCEEVTRISGADADEITCKMERRPARHRARPAPLRNLRRRGLSQGRSANQPLQASYRLRRTGPPNRQIFRDWKAARPQRRHPGNDRLHGRRPAQ